MESHSQGRPWGKLVKVDSIETEVLLFNRECTVGRKKGCDLSFPANKLVSGEHCKIVQDESMGLVWLEDMSTNGTVINMSKLVKKQRHMLQNGDVIYFVFRKNEPEQNIAYVYRSITAQEGTSPDSYVQANDAAPVPNENLEPETKRRKLCDDKDYATELPQTSNAEVADGDKGSVGLGMSKLPTEGRKPDKMEESLTCIICQDLLHDCVSLQPCMHTFCAACYSGWMERSSLCPTCRCPVERLRKNHILNNLVEAYLIQHPEKSRSEEDLKNMDRQNKITQDMLQPKVERSFSDEEGSSDYLFELSDNDSDSSDVSQPLVMCRQCPGYRKDVGQMLFATSSNYWVPGFPVPSPFPPVPTPSTQECSAKPTGEEPSTSSNHPSAFQEYHCPPQAYHLICTCCLQPMPDRQAELNSRQVIAQQCALCQRPFCHMYWGCQRIGCQGCLAPFIDLNLTDKCLDGVLNNNNYESEILQNYLSSRGKSWRDLLQEALQDLQQGTYSLTDCHISANTVLCRCCGLRAFKELAYKYRENIPSSELPAAVSARPDCYWGRNCHTQVKAHHAMKFNHICEQTRFKS
ncbi:E3 ubiquitin-protein ligase CHFR-like isoform X2 [Thalassophryne amazonica]|uniref:E3 ubiquitin-protein ligase CHFR-like isoform X2 n=1 Tax=Thalassophryne amazonica TaxID=390379 RepID=UPI00147139C7|nr:E3 ubiquitin-protein ligase CHFR-like isoform X2 [Thalassophryne amazonica]